MIKKMKFDVIISNPPYQMNDKGNKASSKPIYHFFVEQAKQINPKFISMIIPAKWYSGGKGLDRFRSDMLNDDHIRRIVDYTNSADCFPGVDVAGGICYFLWDRDSTGSCNYTNNYNRKTASVDKKLNRYQTFIRYPIAETIINRVGAYGETTMDTMVSARKPFGLATNVTPMEQGDLMLRYNNGIGKFMRSNVMAGNNLIDKWKVMVSYLSAEHAGQPDKNGQFKVLSLMEVLPPSYICTETYLIAGAFDNEEMANNLLRYLKTKFVRFLIGQMAISQHITKNSFSFVPIQDFSCRWTDEELFTKYNLTYSETSFIESMIKPMDR